MNKISFETVETTIETMFSIRFELSIDFVRLTKQHSSYLRLLNVEKVLTKKYEDKSNRMSANETRLCNCL